ncbi:PREDICTED: sperm-egg fusion protein Juno [Miniopterus natalensis]|uniref:sperm-egg fusion protein Juno n=1 Tax=Miniopterus natalensis TaxID=291302 RepID=UPI0007A6EF88|nr:PREDICTED: sperm-egg fusion protein Juno [Miniopterus natalensis]
MEWWWQLLLGLWIVVTPIWTGGKQLCMKTKHHKQEPGPEDVLHDQGIPWRGNACCTFSTGWGAHTDAALLYSFALIPCGLLKLDCQKHFYQAMCFYQCSPNLGPWVQQVGRLGWEVDPYGHEEGILDVPLCRGDYILMSEANMVPVPIELL